MKTLKNVMFSEEHKVLSAILLFLLVVFVSTSIGKVADAFLPHEVYAEGEEEGGGKTFIDYLKGSHTFDEIKEKVGNKNLGFNAVVATFYFMGENFINSHEMLADTLKFEDTELGVARDLWSLLSVIGVGFAVIYLIMDLNRAAFMAASNWTIQSLISPLLKFGACLFVIQYGGRFVSAILGFGNWLIDQVVDPSTPAAGGSFDTICEMFKNMNLGVSIAFLLAVLIFWLASLLVGLIFIYKSIVYKIEVILRVGVTPVILGDVWEGKNSGAVRWFKKLAGCMLYGASFILIMKIGGEVFADNFSLSDDDIWNAGLGTALDLVGAIFGSLIIPIAEVGALGVAKQACMEVFM